MCHCVGQIYWCSKRLVNTIHCDNVKNYCHISIVSNTYCVVFLFFFVLCTLCCQFLWVVHFWLPLRYYLMFICSWRTTLLTKIISLFSNVYFQGDIERRVRHYYYLIWPDVGVPDSTDYMLRFVDTVRWDIRSDMIGPIVVHCRYFFFESFSCCLFFNAHFFKFIIDLLLMRRKSVIID